MTGRRFWSIYAAVWIPVAGIYAALLASTRSMPWRIAVLSGVTYVIPAAILGAVAWWVSGRIRFPERRGYVGFFAVQIGLAITFALLWSSVSVLGMMRSMPFQAVLNAARYFLGWQILSGIWVYGLVAGAWYVIRVNRRLRERDAAAARADALRVRAELAALRGQLDPHFLFNTLHSVTALVRIDAVRCEQALLRFADLLRYVLDVNREPRDEIALSEEWAFVRDYLALESLRLGDRLRLVESVTPEALECRIPSFTLQPLVENAIMYAVSPFANGATVSIRASIRGDDLVIQVQDDGPGAVAEASSSGVGLRAVRQRLETTYPGRGRMEIDTSPGHGFSVSAILPASAA